MSVMSEIRRYNAGRDPLRLQMKLVKMSADPAVFLRGTCHLFYAHLALQGPLKKAPLVWACGDLHLENFGSYKGDNRQAYVDINDFDEAALAPATWDLVRMLTSILVAAPTLGLSPRKARAMSELFTARYAAALAGGKAYWADHRTADGLVHDLLDSLATRSRKAFLDGRTTVQGQRRQFKLDGQKAMAATAAQRAMVKAYMKSFASTQPKPGFFKVLDVAIRIAGTGSLGVERYAVLVQGKGSPDGNYILDLKEALPSSLLPRLQAIKVKQPKWGSEAQRIVAIQSMVQAVPMAFLHAAELGGKSFVLKGLQPTEDRVALAGKQVRHADVAAVLTQMASLLAWAQLRSAGRLGSAAADALIAFGLDTTWRERLRQAAVLCARQTVRDARAFQQAQAKAEPASSPTP
jgi:uncharacterized protein (DUF2252 family)